MPNKRDKYYCVVEDYAQYCYRALQQILNFVEAYQDHAQLLHEEGYWQIPDLVLYGRSYGSRSLGLKRITDPFDALKLVREGGDPLHSSFSCQEPIGPIKIPWPIKKVMNLPWSDWRWEEEERRFKQTAVVPEEWRHEVIGVPFNVTRFQRDGIFEIVRFKEMPDSLPRSCLRKRSTIKPSVRFAVFHRDGFTCQYCGGKAPNVAIQIDHRIPFEKGGSDDIDNLVTSCIPCNSGKSNTVIDQIGEELGNGQD